MAKTNQEMYQKRKEYFKRYAEEHREQINKRQREYLKTHPDRVHATQKAYRERQKLKKQQEMEANGN